MQGSEAPPNPAPLRHASGLRRYARLAGFWGTTAWNLWGPNRGRSIFVLGHPRTGTNWFARILSHYFDVPRYYPKDQHLPVLRPTVMHTHRFAVVPRRTVYVVRDPRDIAVSYYHKIINTAPPAVRGRVARQLPLPFEHEHLRANLPEFIRLVYTQDLAGSLPFGRHVEKARRLGLHTLRYEDLLERGESVVAAAVSHLTGAEADAERVRESLEETSFEKKTGRKRGEQDLRWSSVRKGIAGDWKNHFGSEATRAFQRCDGGTLVALGYEPDEAWARELGGGE